MERVLRRCRILFVVEREISFKLGSSSRTSGMCDVSGVANPSGTCVGESPGTFRLLMCDVTVTNPLPSLGLPIESPKRTYTVGRSQGRWARKYRSLGLEMLLARGARLFQIPLFSPTLSTTDKLPFMLEDSRRTEATT